jgi:flagellar assembly factor FliW
MPCCETKYFGPAAYSGDALITLPEGPMGFPGAHTFVLIQRAAEYPLVYMQSTDDPDLCFLALPVLSLDAAYRLAIRPEDAAAVQTSATPAIGPDVLCLALLSLHENGATANLLAPVVVNLSTRTARQCINVEPGYSHQQPLPACNAEEGAAA